MTDAPTAIPPEPVSPRDEAQDTADAPARQDFIPGAVLLIAMVIAFLAMFLDDGGMTPWAVSARTLAEGRLSTLQLHMFAHGSILHIVFNGIALVALSAQVIQRLGSGPRAWLKLLVLFELSGLCGALAYIGIHRWNEAPMLGASGAIFGLLGFLLRLRDGSQDDSGGEHDSDGGIVPLFSRAMGRIVIEVIKNNVWLFVAFGLFPLITGQSGGLAWEAHLGGFVAGLALCPYLMRGNRAPAARR